MTHFEFLSVALFIAAILFERRWFHYAVLVWWAALLTLITYGLQTEAVQ